MARFLTRGNDVGSFGIHSSGQHNQGIAPEHLHRQVRIDLEQYFLGNLASFSFKVTRGSSTATAV